MRRPPPSPPPPLPYCIIAKVAFGCYLRTMRVPEAWIPRVVANGWTVLVRDSEIPRPVEPFALPDLQSNPRRMEDDETTRDYGEQ